MADIITRLVLKSDAFDANLKRAKGSVNSFQNDISSMAKTAGAGVLKFAGTLGIAAGAGEAFMKTIRGSQTTSDAFDDQMYACQTSVNEFFTSLSTGDFTRFLGGLDDIISKAKDVNAAMDQLGNARISYDYFREDFNTNMAEARRVAMDNEAPKEQREAALGAWAKAIEDKRKKAESVKSDALTALKAVVVEGNLLHSDDITLEDVDKAFNYDVAGKDRASLKSAVTNRYDTYKVKYAALERRKKSGGLADWAFPESKESKDRAAFNDFIASKQAELNKEYKDAIIFNELLVKKKDEELIKVGQLGKEYKQINRELEDDERTFNRARDRVNKPKKDPKEDKDKKPLKNTLAWYDVEISRLNKELMSATTMQARSAIQTTINELEKKKVNIKIVVEQEAFKIKHGEMKDGELLLPASKAPDIAKIYSDSGTEFARLESMYSEMIAERQSALSKAIDIEQQTFIQSQIDKLKNTLKELRSMQKESNVTGDIYSAYQNNAGSKKQGSFDLRKEIGNMKLPKFESPIKKKDIDLNEEYAKSLGLIGSVMGNLSGATNDSASAYLQWGANVLSSIGMAIPAITKLTTAKTAEAAAGAAASAAEIPLTGWMLAAGAALSVVAAMASIPKFANGGVVPGISFAGDKVPAMLNSGEMILNGSQQANLFKMLNSKLYAGLDVSRPNITPSVGHLAGLIAPSENKVQVEFGKARVVGPDIILSVNNTLKKQGKKPL